MSEAILQQILSEIQLMKNDVQDAKSELKLVKDELQNVKVELHDVKADLQNVKSDLHEVKADLQNVKSELHDVKADLQNVKSELHDVKADLQNVKSELHDVKSQMNSRFDTLEARLSIVDTNMATKEDIADLPYIKTTVNEALDLAKKVHATQEKHERTLDILSRRSIDQEAELRAIR